MVKLTVEQQSHAGRNRAGSFRPVPGGWGKHGATNARLSKADATTLRSALGMAWRNIAPKSLVEKSSRTNAAHPAAMASAPDDSLLTNQTETRRDRHCRWRPRHDLSATRRHASSRRRGPRSTPMRRNSSRCRHSACWRPRAPTAPSTPRRAAAIPASSMSKDRTSFVMPDRSGNNRIDSYKNIVAGSGFLQLIFFVPGIDETLRVGGKGTLSADPVLLRHHGRVRQAAARGAQNGTVSEAYFHCGKALMRSKLWSSRRSSARLSEHRRGDRRPDLARRARAAGRGRSALQDAAV